MADTLTSGNELTWASFPIEKVESDHDGNVLVWGKATDDTVDSDQQIVDPNFAAKAIQEWMETGPNVRVQHQAQRDPAGVGVSFERDGTAHWVKSKIIEPVAKQLVLGGALRAYSVGIARPTIMRDNVARGGRITDGQIVEISLVDRPANKNCGIQLVKGADGSLVTKVFGGDVLEKVADVTVTLPADVQVGFSPADLAKIVNRRNGNGSDNGFVIKSEVDDQIQAVLKAEQAELDAKLAADGWIVTGKRKLTTEARNALSSSDFVFPKDRRYPIHDESHARNALSRVAQHGTPEEKKKVRAAVRRRYPGIGQEAKAQKAGAAMPVAQAAPASMKDGDPADRAVSAALDAAQAAQDADTDADKQGGGPSLGGAAVHGTQASPASMKKKKSLCSECGAMQNRKHSFCSECGKAMMNAPEIAKNHDFMCLGCGRDLDKGEKFCPGCGKENPGYNPMADLKIPVNKGEGSRVADAALAETMDPAVETAEPTVTKKFKQKIKIKPETDNDADDAAEKARGDRVASKPGQMPGEDAGTYTSNNKPVRTGDRIARKPGQMPGEDMGTYQAKKAAKKPKGKPFGGNQAPPFGAKADDAEEMEDRAAADAKRTSKKGLDAPLTSPKAEKGKKGKAKPVPTGSTPGSAGGAVARGGDEDTVPSPRSSDAGYEFNRDAGTETLKFHQDPQGTTTMRLKSLGISAEDGFVHDLTCPAYSWDDVNKAYPSGMVTLSADTWQQKALEAAASAPLEQAKAASQLGQAVFTIKSADMRDIADVKYDIHKAFKDAQPGPGSAPTPGSVMPGRFQRPQIAGRAAYSPSGYNPHGIHATVPDHSLAASQFGRGYLSSGTADESPANKNAGAPYPTETGRVTNLDYSSIAKEQVLAAFNAMHDHFDRVFPGVCPMNQGGMPLDAGAHRLQMSKSDDQSDVTKQVSPDGMTGKGRKKMKKKLTRAVMKGKMPIDQARIRMGKKPFNKPGTGSPVKAAQPELTKSVELVQGPAMLTQKDLRAALAKSQKISDKKIAALTRAVNILADQPDPATQPFKGTAIHPIRKSASPEGVQGVADIAARTQSMILAELETQARHNTDPVQREAAWQQVLKMKGLAPSS